MPRRIFPLLIGVLAAVACQTITEKSPTETAVQPPAAIPVVVVPVPVPQPTGAPPAAPAPQPEPSAPSGLPPGDWPDNTNPVAKLTAKVYFVEVFGTIVPYPPAPVGSRIHLDVTPTDQYNRHTRARGTPVWTYTNRGIINIGGNSPYNPVLDARGEGDLECWAEVDGIRSNTVHIQIR